jgi:microcystin-dependent protein
MIGSITIYAGNKIPEGYHLCDGSRLSIHKYPDLYKVIGGTCGYNSEKQTFKLPDCRGRVILGSGAGINMTERMAGDTGGSETVQLQDHEIPTHSFATFIRPVNCNTTQKSGISTYDPRIGEGMGLETRGGNKSHENMPPFITFHVIIKIGDESIIKCIDCFRPAKYMVDCCKSNMCLTCATKKECLNCEKPIKNLEVI